MRWMPGSPRAPLVGRHVAVGPRFDLGRESGVDLLRAIADACAIGTRAITSATAHAPDVGRMFGALICHPRGPGHPPGATTFNGTPVSEVGVDLGRLLRNMRGASGSMYCMREATAGVGDLVVKFYDLLWNRWDDSAVETFSPSSSGFRGSQGQGDGGSGRLERLPGTRSALLRPDFRPTRSWSWWSTRNARPRGWRTAGLTRVHLGHTADRATFQPRGAAFFRAEGGFRAAGSRRPRRARSATAGAVGTDACTGPRVVRAPDTMKRTPL